MTWGRWYWPLFLVASLLLLLIPEIYALVTNYHNSLSYWVWTSLRVNQGAPIDSWTAPHYLAAGVYLVVVTWLTGHLFFRWWAAK